MQNLSEPHNSEVPAGKILLIGVTGGTGGNVVKGFLEQGLTDLAAMTRTLDLDRPGLSRLHRSGIELVEANLDDPMSLERALTNVAAVYCHATAGDTTKADPREVERAKKLAQAAHQAGVSHFVYNSAGGCDRNSGIPHIEQKRQVEDIFKAAQLPTTMLRACLFMEEFWKSYTRPSVLKGTFPFALPPDRPLHLITTKDMGRVAAYVLKHPEHYIGREIELAGDVQTPLQMTAAFAKAQGTPVKYRKLPPWIFFLLRKSLYDLILWYRDKVYQADVEHLRTVEFPGLLTTFEEFLAETHWANAELTYEDL